MSTVAMVHQLGNWSSRDMCAGKGVQRFLWSKLAGRNWRVRRIAWRTKLRIVVCWSKPRSIEMPFKSLLNFSILSERRTKTGGGNGFGIWEPMIVNDTFFFGGGSSITLCCLWLLLLRGKKLVLHTQGREDCRWWWLELNGVVATRWCSSAASYNPS